ncbi:dienelactone hydrolase family protein [Dyella sp. 20L07]|uniref:dienelactone hydrolase family protein n=1 Tax=Dyella sp. 20L07 TaxID=3384240 RepID=UPI003D2C8595
MSEYGKLITPRGNLPVYIDRPMYEPAPVVLVLHEVFGVDGNARRTCRVLAQEGFIAVCPDLFWRHAAGVSLDHRSLDDWKKGMAIYYAYDFNAGVSDVYAAQVVGRELPGSNGKVGVIGYCLGGLLSYLVSVRFDPDVAISYYGEGIEKYLAEASGLTTPLVLHFACDDEVISLHDQQRIGAVYAGSDLVTIYSYRGCRHAFARYGGANYDEVAARLANERTLAFLGKYLH